MTEKQIEEIVNTQRLPKDELDDVTSNLFGFLPTIMLLVGSTLAFMSKQTNTSMTTKNKLIFFFISLAFFLYTAWTKISERKLKSIQTNLTRQQNILLIEKIAKENEWRAKTNKTNYKEYLIPFVFGHNGHKLTIITLDNEILFNLRNLGSIKGRMPYLFGIDTVKEIKLRRQIKNNA